MSEWYYGVLSESIRIPADAETSDRMPNRLWARVGGS